MQGVIDKCKDYITLKEFPYCLLDYSQTHAYIYHQPRLGYQKSRFSNDLLRIPWYRIFTFTAHLILTLTLVKTDII